MSLREAVARRHLLVWTPWPIAWLVIELCSPTASAWARLAPASWLAYSVVVWRLAVRAARRGRPPKPDERPLNASIYGMGGVGILGLGVALATTWRSGAWTVPVLLAALCFTVWLIVDQRRALHWWNVEVGPYPEPWPRHITPDDDAPR